MRKWIRNNRGFVALLLVFGLFRSAVADWNPVPTGSMRPTIQEGDVVLVDRLAYDLKVPLTSRVVSRLGEPARGDIVVFFSPQVGTRLVKRLVALPGDTVEMRDKVVRINGRESTYAPLGLFAEPRPAGAGLQALHLREQTADGSRVVQWLRPQGGFDGDSFGPLVVPADHYLMLGDNRDNSADSRYFGLVPRAQLVGRATNVLVSLDITDRWQPRSDRFGLRLE
jgi:signal peptidase I